MCTSTESTFAWVGAIAVNSAFVFFVGWGATTLWPLGFVISILYTAVLFALAKRLDYHEEEYHDPVHEDDDVREDYGNTRRRSVLVSILWGLAVIALGVTGLFLPMNIFYCPDDERPPSASGRWETNISALPESVQPWAESNDMYYDPNAIISFAYLPSTASTLFSGRANSTAQRATLWVVTSSSSAADAAVPQEFSNVVEPHAFTLVSEGKACFLSDQNNKNENGDGGLGGNYPRPIQKRTGVACSDGRTVANAVGNSTTLHVSPHKLIAVGGILWYKGYPSSGTGSLIFSLDPYTMQETLHSTYHAGGGRNDINPSPNNDDDSFDAERNCWKRVTRQRAVGALFFSAIPIAVTSIVIWVKQQVPSMGVTTYIGISAMAFCVYTSIDASGERVDDFFKWWNSVAGALWIIALTDVFFSNRPTIDKAPLAWGLNIGGLVYVSAMIVLTEILNDANSKLWQWMLVNLFAFLPMAFVGIATDQIFLLILCALGFLLDAWRLASFLAHTVTSYDFEVPITFVVLAVAGLCITWFGWVLNQHQEAIQNVLIEWMERHSVTRVSHAGHTPLRTVEDSELNDSRTVPLPDSAYDVDGAEQ